MPAYLAPERVRSFTGVKPSHLDLTDDEDLRQELMVWISQAQEMVEGYVGVIWDEFDLSSDQTIVKMAAPAGVQNAVLRIVANMVAQSRIRRQSGTVNLDEFRQVLVPDSVFTTSIKDDLEPYMGGGKRYQESILPGNDMKFGFNAFRVRNRKQLDRDAAWSGTYDRRR